MNEKNIESPVETTDWKDMYLRLSADMDNLRKRIFKEKEELVIKTKTSMIEPLLDIDSDIAIASKHSEDEGVKLIVSKLEKFLSTQGIQTIQTDSYDENLHEVISVIETDSCKTNCILDVVSKGYMIGDKIIRHPKIILTK